MIVYKRGEMIVRHSEIDDIYYLKDKLRDSDIDEIWASHGYSPEEALMECFEDSVFCFTIQIKDIPVAMFGLNNKIILGNEAVCWMLASDDLEFIRINFIRSSKEFIGLFLQFYPKIHNFVDSRNKESIRWLKYCGANIGDEVEYGIARMPFRYFYFERN